MPTNDEDAAPVAGDLDSEWNRARGIHNAGCNVGWLDGHVEWMKTGNFYCGQTPADLSLLDLQLTRATTLVSGPGIGRCRAGPHSVPQSIATAAPASAEAVRRIDDLCHGQRVAGRRHRRLAREARPSRNGALQAVGRILRIERLERHVLGSHPSPRRSRARAAAARRSAAPVSPSTALTALGLVGRPGVFDEQTGAMPW
ncbi:MAG: hypothetical protein M5U09_23025 [Gammaproteobacteria bacterium]|nr:hypothetical protein [Gammaproteobacteria bacterium]